MNFFEQQDAARRNSNVLIGMYIGCVVLLVMASYFASLLTFYSFLSSEVVADYFPHGFSWWQGQVFLVSNFATLALIALGSLYKMRQLSSGGESVAAMLGGQRIQPNTDDANEKRLLNVVEEMALASGVGVPPVYVMPQESGINAFAAGYSLDDAVIGVTRGCLDQLSRDELQGVIAHEFSHILNGDMKRNTELVGMLHGISLIYLTGLGIFRISANTGRYRSSNRKSGGVPQLILFGLALMLIGSLGILASRIIKAAISRQREYLADASAVQFTRNPTGIASALKKVGGIDSTEVNSTHAEEFSHFFFSRGKGWKISWWNRPLSTHPPLEERIRRLDPSFKGQYIQSRPSTQSKSSHNVAPSSVMGFSEHAQPTGVSTQPHHKPVESAQGTSTGGRTRTISVAPTEVVKQVGHTTAEHLALSTQLLHEIPDELRAASHETFSSVALVYALLLDQDPQIRRKQLAYIDKNSAAGIAHEAHKLFDKVHQVDNSLWMPLVDISSASLRALTADQYRNFVQVMLELIQADDKITFFEFVLQKVIRHRLKRAFSNKRSETPRFLSLNPVAKDLNLLLSMLAHLGHKDAAQTRQAFGAAVLSLPQSAQSHMRLLSPQACSYAQLDQALDQLEQTSPPIKQHIINACSHCIMGDGIVTYEEGELLRAISDIFDCPIPPFIPDEVMPQPTAQSSKSSPAAV